MRHRKRENMFTF